MLACLRIALLGLAAALFMASPAAADEFGDAVAALGKGSFAERASAIERLGALGDPRGVAVLKALGAGDLQVRKSDGLPVVVRGSTLLDAVTGADLGPADGGDLEKIRVNNAVRNAVASAFSKLRLVSPDRAERLAAAQEAVRHASSETMAILRRALQTESDPGVRSAMEFALLAAQLTAGTPEERQAAIAGLSGSLDPQVRGLLSQTAADPKTEPAVREAAQAGLDAAERKLQFLAVALNLFQGVSLGSILLLAAMGLAITFGVMGVINMAHGEMIMVGAYAAFVTQELFRAYLPASMIDWYLVAALPMAFAVAGALGIGLERSVIRWLYGRPLETLLATWGISLILQQLVRTIFGATNKEVANPNWMTGGMEVVGGIVLTYNRMVIVLFCLAVFFAMVFVLRYTSFGLNMRAVTQNRDMARTMGINSARVDALTFGLGSGIAGIAGVALSQVGNVSPNLGQLYIVDSFMVVVFGGVGNLAGTLVGALTLGIVNKFLEPLAGAVLGKVVVLVLIILFIQRRPRGLFALKGRAAEA